MNLLSQNIIGLFRSQNIESLKFCLKTFHLGSTTFAVNKASLAALRKETGFSLSNCKKALELQDGDINLSKEWLEKEAKQQGWAKASKLSGRVTTQGLIGFNIGNGNASLVEVNCETDFVARNQEFQDLVSNIARELTLSNASTTAFKKEVINKQEIENLKTSDGVTMSDTVALAVGKIGENIQISRGATLCTNIPGSQIIGYTHPSSSSNPSKVGKYGVVVAFKNLGDNQALARDLCAHIIGRNPSEIGSFDDVDDAENKDKIIAQNKPAKELLEETPLESEEDFVEESSQVLENEFILMKQKFLSNDDLTVGLVLKESGIEILDFIRFQVGELEQNT